MSTPVVESDRALKNLLAKVQWRVLEFTRALAASAPCGIPGQHRLQFAGAMPADDLQFMQ